MNVQLPKTDFPMKGNLAQTEPTRIDAWTQNKIYQKMVTRKAPKGKFVMPDGPPYANNYIHVGHAVNKILKDMVIKYKSMSGYQAAFIPGWDCHGLPIELNITKKLGAKRKDTTDAEIRKMCREEAAHWMSEQRKQFVRLGVLADWENPYLTMQPAYEADEIRVLAQIFKNGIFARGNKPVYWCPTLQTALAAAEIEYRDHKSPSVYVKFALPAKKASLVIWTTTPWTLPANYGIALNADFDYGVYSSGNENLILATGLKETFEKETGLTLTLISTHKGKEFEGLKARHPFIDRDSLVILGDHVTLEAGTGAVHTAPGHGLDDYVVGSKYGLPVQSPVNEAGKFTDEVPDLVGMSIWDANPKIVETLRERGALLGFKEITHSYPHNPRSKTPLIFRATPQWFIKMDEAHFPLRQKCLTAAEKDIQYFPKWGYQRLQAMLSNTPDWCVSRQRIWGVPIPVYYCTQCDEPLVEPQVMNRLADKMESTGQGIEVYHSHPPSEFTAGHKCGKCNHSEFKVGKDILDVWFDSGICHTAVQKRRPEMGFPADVYLEGSDQHRGWFQTSLVSAMAAENKTPFKALITHGFVNDAQGYKMSKSLGNTVDPMEIIKENGAEILRLWAAHEDYGKDLTISKEMIARMSDTYRRFRNTIRFLLGNLGDFDPNKDRVNTKDMTPLDQWALHRLNDLIVRCTQAYDSFEFYKVYHALNNYFALDLSATYLDILKDRLYTGKVDGVKRRGSQTVLYDITVALCGIMAPMATFLAEETYSYLPGEKAECILLSQFPESHPEWVQTDLAARFDQLLEVRSVVSKELEELRKQKIIGAGLDAQVEITASEDLRKVLEGSSSYLREFLIVSQVTLKTDAALKGLEVKVKAQKADGIKCERCWHYDLKTGSDSRFANQCPKCVEAQT